MRHDEEEGASQKGREGDRVYVYGPLRARRRRRVHRDRSDASRGHHGRRHPRGSARAPRVRSVGTSRFSGSTDNQLPRSERPRFAVRSPSACGSPCPCDPLWARVSPPSSLAKSSGPSRTPATSWITSRGVTTTSRTPPMTRSISPSRLLAGATGARARLRARQCDRRPARERAGRGPLRRPRRGPQTATPEVSLRGRPWRRRALAG
jgi:hypothetical protein